MPRFAAVLLLLLSLLGCGGVTSFGFFTNFHQASTSGVVSIVHFTVISGPGGTLVNVTIVTLIQNGFSTTNTFCGDVRNQFPMNTFVSISFDPGNTCNTIVQVTLSPPLNSGVVRRLTSTLASQKLQISGREQLEVGTPDVPLGAYPYGTAGA